MPFYNMFWVGFFFGWEGGLSVIFKLLVLCDIILVEEKGVFWFYLLIVCSLTLICSEFVILKCTFRCYCELYFVFNSLFFTVQYLKLRTFLLKKVYVYLNLGSVSFQFF